MESFSNQTINFNGLPDYKKTELTPIAKRYKKVLLVATGALLSPLSFQQGQTIPCTAHAVEIGMG